MSVYVICCSGNASQSYNVKNEKNYDELHCVVGSLSVDIYLVKIKFEIGASFFCQPFFPAAEKPRGDNETESISLFLLFHPVPQTNAKTPRFVGGCLSVCPFCAGV